MASLPSLHYAITLKEYDTASKDITDAAKKAIDEFAANGAKYVINPFIWRRSFGEESPK